MKRLYSQLVIKDKEVIQSIEANITKSFVHRDGKWHCIAVEGESKGLSEILEEYPGSLQYKQEVARLQELILKNLRTIVQLQNLLSQPD